MTDRCLAVLLLLLLLSGTAAASERSERLHARGLIEFQASRYAEALKLFDEAVQADPEDVTAWYYRGLTYTQLGKSQAAIADLRAALKRKPDFPEAALDLGIALVQSGAVKDAVVYLERAQRVRDLEAQASLFLGLAHLRLGQTEAARLNFRRAAAHDPTLTASARYYEGLADYRDGDMQRAREHFEHVVAVSPDTAIGREAALFLSKMHQAQPPTYRLYAETGLQYDTNAVLAPSDETLKSRVGISRQADGLAVFTLGGSAVLWSNRQAQFSVGYEFFQSVYFNLSSFDLQDHHPSAQFAAAVGPLKCGLLGNYDYYRLENRNFLQEWSALPWLTIPEAALGRTELFYRMRRREFFIDSFHLLRDAFNHTVGVSQFVYLGAPSRSVSVGYRFDREDPINAPGNEFAYDGHEADAGVAWTFPAGVAAEASYAYRYERYARQSNGRRDDEHRGALVAEKRFSEHVGVELAYLATFNSSTDLTFAYDRHIVSLTLRAWY